MLKLNYDDLWLSPLREFIFPAIISWNIFSGLAAPPTGSFGKVEVESEGAVLHKTAWCYGLIFSVEDINYGRMMH